MSAARRVVLLGFMAAGKTTVGRELAVLLGWRFLDVDQEIERRRGRSIPDIFREMGEAAFRAIEAEVASELVVDSEIVLAPGGGWVSGPMDLEALPPETLTVWLRISPEEILRRVSAAGDPGETRPLLRSADPLERVRTLLNAREPIYRKAALWVETEARSPHEIADEIARAVRDLELD